MTGIVYKSTGSWYSIKSLEGDFYECRIKGKFRIQGIKSTNPLAVGDRVDFDLETSNNTQTSMPFKRGNTQRWPHGKYKKIRLINYDVARGL